MHILILDDEIFFANNLASYLQKSLEANCHVAPDFAEALKYLQSHSVDLIISDLNLTSSKSGAHVLEIEKTFPGNEFAIISSMAIPADLLNSKTLNITAYFEKPFELQSLEKFIKQIYLHITHNPT